MATRAVMKMDGGNSVTPEWPDFSEIFNRICNLTISGTPPPSPYSTGVAAAAGPIKITAAPTVLPTVLPTTTHPKRSPPMPPPSVQQQRRISSVSPRMTLKRAESEATPPSTSQRRLRFRDFSQNSEDVIDVIGGDGSSSESLHSVFLGFIHVNNDSDDSGSTDAAFESFVPHSFRREDYCLNRAIIECNAIKAKDGFKDGVLLKCIDAKPMFAYLHYAIYHNTTRLNSFARDFDASPKSQYGAYEEIFAINKSSTSPESALPSNRHAGFIVSCFKLLDDSSKHAALEKGWLSWTGAREIYKYSPRNWNLRRISLHRYACPNGRGSHGFAYVLMCEFGNILHPSNTLQALDMCERLRARNCGHIALYQIQCNYGHSAGPMPQIQHPTATTPGSHTPTTRSWGSPSISRTSPKVPRRQTRNPMLRGYSQDVESTTDSRRRSMLLRVQDHSFDYDPADSSPRGPPTLSPSHHFHTGPYQPFDEYS